MLKLPAAIAASVLLLALSAPSFAADVNTQGSTASPSGTIESGTSGAPENQGQSDSDTSPGQQNGASDSMSNDQSAQMPDQTRTDSGAGSAIDPERDSSGLNGQPGATGSAPNH